MNVFQHSYLEEYQSDLENMSTALKFEESKTEFNDISIDTGANRRSVMGLSQYHAYCSGYGGLPEIVKGHICIHGVLSKH